MNGRHLVIGLVSAAAIAGGAMYWLQVHAFYETLPGTTVLRVVTPEGQLPLSLAAFEGVDATSSPLRFRACAMLADMTEVAHATPAARPDPLTAPGWFGCFDAATLGQDLLRGDAVAYISEHEIHRGVDRVLAVYPDGRAFAWHQLNGTLEN